MKVEISDDLNESANDEWFFFNATYVIKIKKATLLSFYTEAVSTQLSEMYYVDEV